MSFDRFLRECEDEIGGCCYSVTLKSEVVVLHIHKSIAELVVFDREGKIRTKVIDETSFDGDPEIFARQFFFQALNNANVMDKENKLVLVYEIPGTTTRHVSIKLEEIHDDAKCKSIIFKSISNMSDALRVAQSSAPKTKKRKKNSSSSVGTSSSLSSSGTSQGLLRSPPRQRGGTRRIRKRKRGGGAKMS